METQADRLAALQRQLRLAERFRKLALERLPADPHQVNRWELAAISIQQEIRQLKQSPQP